MTHPLGIAELARSLCHSWATCTFSGNAFHRVAAPRVFIWGPGRAMTRQTDGWERETDRITTTRVAP